ncbi:amino acid transporter [uncultured archaeon]|nr:amino acid transporter [uncultured archaeon]
MDVRSSDRKLRRALNTWDLLFLSLGGIIGSGWLFAAYGAAFVAGPAAIYSWIIGGVIILFIALVYAELGSMIPRSGAIVRYGNYTHGGFAGFMLGWAYFLSAVSVPAIEAEAVITVASTWTKPYGLILVETSGVLSLIGILLAGLLMLGFFFLNYFGIRIMGKTNTGMTWWKLVIPVGTVILLLFVGFHASNFNITYKGDNGFNPFGFGAVFQAVAISGIVFSFLGFRQAVDYAGEAATPKKSVPIATIFSVIIGVVLYVGLQVGFLGQIDWSSLGVAPGNWAAFSSSYYGSGTFPAAIQKLHDAPFPILASAAGLVPLTYLLYADAFVSPSGTLNVYLGTSVRTLYGIGTIGGVPKSLIKIMEKTRIPFIPLLASLIIGYVFFLPFPSWYKLVGFITSATVFTYIVGGPSLRVLRKHAPELHRPFKLPGSSIIAPIAFIGASLVVYWSGWPLDGYLAIGIFIGLLVYAVFVAYMDVPKIFNRQNYRSGVWVPVYVVVIVIMSYIGEYGQNYVPFPWDVIMVAVVALIFYFWATASGYRTGDIDTMVKEGTQYLDAEDAVVKKPVGAGGGEK